MPTLRTWACPPRGSNDDFNKTFDVTITGTAGAYSIADAWRPGTIGTFTLAPTAQENFFIHDWANVATHYVYYADGYSLSPLLANSQYADALKAYTYQQVADPLDNTGLVYNANGLPVNAWQTCNRNNGSTCWSRAPAKVRAPLNMGYTVVPTGTGKYYVATGTSTAGAYAAAWNNFILFYNGSYPSSASDPIFYQDIYYWAALTAPLNPTNISNPPTTDGSAFLGPYIDALKLQWGPSATV